MINITLKCQEKNICKKVHSFHHYLTWFLAPISVLTPLCVIQTTSLPNETSTRGSMEDIKQGAHS